MRGDNSIDDVGKPIFNKDFAHYHVFDCRTVAEIQRKIIKRRERNAVSRLLNAKNDKDAIAAWNLDLSKTLRVFNVRPVASA